MNDDIQSQSKRKTYRLVAAGLIIIVLAASLPIIGMALWAALQLYGLLITALVGVATAKALPWLAQVLENRIFKLQMNEAAANPIETRAQIALRRQSEIERAMAIDADMEARIKGVEREIREYKQQYPNDDVSEFETTMEELKRLHHQMGEGIEQAARDLTQYEAQTKMLAAKLKMALGVQDLAQAMNPHSVKKAYDRLFSEHATSAIDQKFDSSMASLQQVVRQVEVNQLLGRSGTTLLAPLSASAKA